MASRTEICGRCGGLMVQTGTCMTCSQCGENTGCGIGRLSPAALDGFDAAAVRVLNRRHPGQRWYSLRDDADPPPHLVNAARAVHSVLAARHPEHSWVVEFQGHTIS